MLGPTVVWKPNPGPQTYFLQCPAFEVLYGGALGGGKSVGLIADYAREIGKGYGSNWRGIFFRQNFPDMDGIIQYCLEFFGPLYGTKCYNKSKHDWTFPGGERLSFRSLEYDKDVLEYQGQEYQHVSFDELTQWASPYCYQYMKTRIRSSKGVPSRIRAGTNPGGPGHHWVKDRFVDIGPPGHCYRIDTENGFYYRCYIPAKLEDNPALFLNDPNYADRIYEISDKRYADALRNGNWNIVAGAAFTEFDPAIHVVPSQPIPRDAVCWRGLDWGFAEPYACYWLFLDDDSDIHIARELYGYGGAANVGTREGADVVREKIIDIERIQQINCPEGYLDGSTKDQHNEGTTVYDALGGLALNWKPWPKYAGSRISNKQMFHTLLKVVNGRSRIKIHDNCRHLIRTIPALPASKTNIEDVDTHAEDHAYDAVVGSISAKKLPTKQERFQSDLIMQMNRREGIRQISRLPSGGGW